MGIPGRPKSAFPGLQGSDRNQSSHNEFPHAPSSVSLSSLSDEARDIRLTADGQWFQEQLGDHIDSNGLD